jgi:peptidyl-prolyl cis-trans isomerase C
MLEMKNVKLFSIAALVAISINIFAAIPAETIIADFEGGKITMGQLEERVKQLPPMYQPKYSTPEGKENLLDMMCTEELFYLEALAQDVRNDERYNSMIDNQIKSVYFGEYKKELGNKMITYTEEEKKVYYNEHQDIFVGRTFDESEEEIEKRLRPAKEKDLIDLLKIDLYTKYEVQINEENIMAFILTSIDSNDVNKDNVLIESNNAEVALTVGKFAAMFEDLPPQNKAGLRDNASLQKYLENRVELDIFYLEAMENEFDKNEFVQMTIEQIHRNMMLRTVYNKLVVDPIDLGDESVKNFYDTNILQFSTNPYRKIQAFGFEAEDVAKKMRKQVKKLLKKNNEEDLKTLIAENSVYSAKDGILDHVYDNGIIPGIGKDEVYSEMVWSTKPNKLSKIFKNSKEIFVFFHIIEDIKAVSTPFDEIKDKVKSQMMKDLSKESFDRISIELQTKYNLQKHPENMVEILTAEEYFTKAENAQKRRRFTDAIFYYDKVIEHHKNNSDDYKATFMKGFLYAEEMKDKDNALISFKEVLSNFPEGELHESAQFMIDELEGRSNLIDQFESEKIEESKE